MSDDPFVNAVRAIYTDKHYGFSLPNYEYACVAGCSGGGMHSAVCELTAAFNALKRHDAAFTLAREIYQGGWDTGGPLHIILDDGNCERHWVEECLKGCEETHWAETSEPGDLLGKSRALLALMREMTDSEIQRIYDRYNEYAR